MSDPYATYSCPHCKHYLLDHKWSKTGIKKKPYNKQRYCAQCGKSWYIREVEEDEQGDNT
jgi:transcription elongation factor Elf1